MKKKRVSIAIKLLVVFFSLYAAITIVQLNVKNASLEDKNRSVRNDIDVLNPEVEKLKDTTKDELDEDLIESIARDQLGLGKPGEQIVKDTSGK